MFFITPIKCLKGQRSLRSLFACQVEKSLVSQWVTRLPIELFWPAKKTNIIFVSRSILPLPLWWPVWELLNLRSSYWSWKWPNCQKKDENSVFGHCPQGDLAHQPELSAEVAKCCQPKWSQTLQIFHIWIKIHPKLWSLCHSQTFEI